MRQALETQKRTTATEVSAVRTAHFVARIGRLLFTNGADTRHVVSSITDVAQHLGQTAHVLVTSEGILVTIGTSEQFSTKVGHEITGTAVNMGRLLAIERIVDNIRDGQRDVDSIERQIDEVETSRDRYPALLVVIGVAATTGSLAMLFGSTSTVAAASFVTGVSSAFLRRVLPRICTNQIVDTFLVAILSGLVAVLTLRLTPNQSPVLALTAAGMILVPGVPLINGIREIASGHAGNGIARLTMGVAAVLAIGFALFTVGFVTGAELPVGSGPGTLHVPEDLLFSGVAAAGFALLFNVPPKGIAFCVLAGMTSHGLRTALELEAGLTLPIASLIGALAAGVIARLAAHVHRVPAVVFAFPGVVAMIPGSFGFRAGIGGLQIMAQGGATSPELVATTLGLAITTAVTTIAIGIGLALSLSSSPWDPLISRKRKA
ncbi:threonine/serine ThrE exporter family protein [Aliirhizobium cellulosilyticum]|uniref:Uncharacterized membrane protein YjjP (DUF1212 family) n=1 Tax=Aliirhizobium cellulosilyticum TaxID=393664 RepID=A0A7W6UZ95_9HYPH|nr:threonine/serine exporter family protein [Rhizobium cellulosilyticum]MBB4349368.1 uncharacterized membrane protein YjjP (DUF1212 family) [Rhizobium cellulosilyticum]MBB4412410.1 uncharacterized membrane protein YjjP (DUF1212 family) [Rhizobium cellulosilyticum]MBB4447042.1 uncharacterized membrane protein YjjP (DUF1212 family) [Rhizobium cellulosilyticum]